MVREIAPPDFFKLAANRIEIMSKNQRNDKRPDYAAPRLVQYGSLAELTASGSGVMTENNMAMGMMRRP